MKWVFLFVVITCSMYVARSQSGPYLFSGAGFMGSGQIGLLADDAEAAIVLPALLANRNRSGWSAGVAMRTGLSDLFELAGSAHIRLPWKDQLGVGVQHTGIDGYSEQRVSFSYARKLFTSLHAGVQFDLHRNTAEEYETLYAASWSVSIYAPLTRELAMSAWLYNPMGDLTSIDLPSMARIGLMYSPSERVGVALEAEKDWRHELKLKAGIHYQLHQRLKIRFGVGTDPSRIHAGITWGLFQDMSITGGWRYHSRLGSSLAASVGQSPRS